MMMCDQEELQGASSGKTVAVGRGLPASRAARAKPYTPTRGFPTGTPLTEDATHSGGLPNDAGAGHVKLRQPSV